MRAVFGERNEHQLDVDWRSVLSPPPADPVRPPGGHRLACDLAPLIAARVAEHEVVDGTSVRLLPRVAEERGRGRVPVRHPLGGVHDDHGHRAVLDERLELGQPAPRRDQLRRDPRVRASSSLPRGRPRAPRARAPTRRRSRRAGTAPHRDHPRGPPSRPPGRATRARPLRTSGCCPSACAPRAARRPRRPSRRPCGAIRAERGLRRGSRRPARRRTRDRRPRFRAARPASPGPAHPAALPSQSEPTASPWCFQVCSTGLTAWLRAARIRTGDVRDDPHRRRRRGQPEAAPTPARAGRPRGTRGGERGGGARAVRRGAERRRAARHRHARDRRHLGARAPEGDTGRGARTGDHDLRSRRDRQRRPLHRGRRRRLPPEAVQPRDPARTDQRRARQETAPRARAGTRPRRLLPVPSRARGRGRDGADGRRPPPRRRPHRGHGDVHRPPRLHRLRGGTARPSS